VGSRWRKNSIRPIFRIYMVKGLEDTVTDGFVAQISASRYALDISGLDPFVWDVPALEGRLGQNHANCKAQTDPNWTFSG